MSLWARQESARWRQRSDVANGTTMVKADKPCKLYHGWRRLLPNSAPDHRLVSSCLLLRHHISPPDFFLCFVGPRLPLKWEQMSCWNHLHAISYPIRLPEPVRHPKRVARKKIMNRMGFFVAENLSSAAVTERGQNNGHPTYTVVSVTQMVQIGPSSVIPQIYFASWLPQERVRLQVLPSPSNFLKLWLTVTDTKCCFSPPKNPAPRQSYRYLKTGSLIFKARIIVIWSVAWNDVDTTVRTAILSILALIICSAPRPEPLIKLPSPTYIDIETLRISGTLKCTRERFLR